MGTIGEFGSLIGVHKGAIWPLIGIFTVSCFLWRRHEKVGRPFDFSCASLFLCLSFLRVLLCMNRTQSDLGRTNPLKQCVARWPFAPSMYTSQFYRRLAQPWYRRLKRGPILSFCILHVVLQPERPPNPLLVSTWASQIPHTGPTSEAPWDRNHVNHY